MSQIFIVASAFIAGALVDAIVHRVFILSRLNTKICNLNLACQERQTQLQLANDDIRRYQLRLLELSGCAIACGESARKPVKLTFKNIKQAKRALAAIRGPKR